MSKNVLKFSWVLALGVILIFTACTKESAVNSQEVENYTDDSVYELQFRGNCGKFGCYEFVFPVTIAFPDSTTAEVGSYAEMREAIKTWREANLDVQGRPSLVFPLSLLDENGEVVVVESKEQLVELGIKCIRGYFGKHGPKRPKHHHGDHDFCFTLAFPVTMQFPNGDTVTYDTKEALHAALKEWRINHRGPARPRPTFPFNVTLKDGTSQVINSVEDLKALKESCSSEG